MNEESTPQAVETAEATEAVPEASSEDATQENLSLCDPNASKQPVPPYLNTSPSMRDSLLSYLNNIDKPIEAHKPLQVQPKVAGNTYDLFPDIPNSSLHDAGNLNLRQNLDMFFDNTDLQQQLLLNQFDTVKTPTQELKRFEQDAHNSYQRNQQEVAKYELSQMEPDHFLFDSVQAYDDFSSQDEMYQTISM